MEGLFNVLHTFNMDPLWRAVRVQQLPLCFIICQVAISIGVIFKPPYPASTCFQLTTVSPKISYFPLKLVPDLIPVLMPSEPVQFGLKHINLPGHSFQIFSLGQQFLRTLKPGLQIPGPSPFSLFGVKSQRF